MLPIVIEYDDSNHTRERIEIGRRSEGSGYWLVRKEKADGSWRLIGREPISRVVVDRESDAVT